MMNNQQPVLFENNTIRRTWQQAEWYYVVQDVVQALTKSKDVKQYLKRMRSRDKALSENWSALVQILPVQTEGGVQNMACSNREGLFRIIQSISSPHAEPFKLWLAEVGAERMEETEDPQLIMDRLRLSLQKKGYDDNWIAARIRSIVVREQLTAEWKKRGVKGQEYAFLTDLIMKGTFDLNSREYRVLKGLVKENLRDHMSTLELVYVILSEETTKQLAQKEDAKGFEENRKVADRASKIAGDSRKRFEDKTGLKIISSKNFLDTKGKS